MARTIINTPDAPAAIGTYSQAVLVGRTIYLSGQIPLVPATGELITGDIDPQIRRVFDNLQALCRARGSLDAACFVGAGDTQRLGPDLLVQALRLGLLLRAQAPGQQVAVRPGEIGPIGQQQQQHDQAQHGRGVVNGFNCRQPAAR